MPEYFAEKFSHVSIICAALLYEKRLKDCLKVCFVRIGMEFGPVFKNIE
jgi:hypothetical protein